MTNKNIKQQEKFSVRNSRNNKVEILLDGRKICTLAKDIPFEIRTEIAYSMTRRLNRDIENTKDEMFVEKSFNDILRGSVIRSAKVYRNDGEKLPFAEERVKKPTPTKPWQTVYV